MDIPEYLVLGQCLGAVGRRTVWVQYWLWIWRHQRSERKHAVLPAPCAQAFAGHLSHSAKRWHFDSDDGRFIMDFQPILDRAAYTSALLIASDQHQVFGRFTGKAVLDDGTVLHVRDFLGFAEKVANRW